MVLDVASAALPGTASRVTAIKAILLAAAVSSGCVVLMGRPKLGRRRVNRWCLLGLNIFNLWGLDIFSLCFLRLGGDVRAVPDWIVGMNPMSVMVTPMPFRCC